MAINKDYLSIGDQGDEVKKLQNALIGEGYNVGSKGADGVFGNDTLAAVKQYQTDKKLKVDGLAGKSTLGSLYGTSGNGTGTAVSQSVPTSSATVEKGFAYDPFQRSNAVKQADAMLNQLMSNAPGQWVDPYKDRYLGYLSEYENRDPFSYDFNSDALYNQYKDLYIQQGQMAMMDTMGQAAAMTGGYGNSYAQAVGQQAYNQQLGQLNNIMPELYDRAYSRYNQEGQDLLNLYGLYTGLSEQDYNKYRGDVDNYYRQLDAARNHANDLYQKEYGEWSDKVGIDFDTYKILQDQLFTSQENEKNREFQREENDRKIAAESAYKTISTEDTMKWKKLFEGAKSLPELETLASLLQGVVGPEEAARWYDIYATNFKVNTPPSGNPTVTGTIVGGGGGLKNALTDRLTF